MICSNGLSPHVIGLRKCSSWSLGWKLNLELPKYYDVEVKITAWQCLVLWHLINLVSLRIVIVDLSKAGICAEIWSWDYINIKQECSQLYPSKVEKVKCTLVKAPRLCTSHTAHRGSRGMALLFHDHGPRRGWVVSITPRPLFTHGKDPVPIYPSILYL